MTQSTLYAFIDDERNSLIAITADPLVLQEMAGGEESTLSVEGIVLLFEEQYTISDIHINPLQKVQDFKPDEYEGCALGAACKYNILVRCMVNPR